MPKNAKKLICIFCLFVRAEMTSRHKNSSKTLQNTPKMVQNSINGLNIYIGSPSKKKKRKILTQGKSCFFTVNATKYNINRILLIYLIQKKTISISASISSSKSSTSFSWKSSMTGPTNGSFTTPVLLLLPLKHDSA